MDDADLVRKPTNFCLIFACTFCINFIINFVYNWSWMTFSFAAKLLVNNLEFCRQNNVLFWTNFGQNCMSFLPVFAVKLVVISLWICHKFNSLFCLIFWQIWSVLYHQFCVILKLFCRIILVKNESVAEYEIAIIHCHFLFRFAWKQINLIWCKII